MVKKTEYIPRIVDSELAETLDDFGAVSIIGPKWCGKTRTALEVCRSHIYIDTHQAMLDAISVDPYIALQGNVPRLIDEWQIAPILWGAVRHEVDERGESGQFILTGSTTPIKKNKPRHSGAGRFAFLKMLPLSLFESRESSGEVSLSDLFEGKAKETCISALSFQEMVEALVRGGWPAAVTKNNKSANIARNYLQAIIEKDEEGEVEVDAVTRNPEKMRALLQSLARNITTPAKLTTILDDIEERTGELSRTAAYAYLGDLKRQFVVMEAPCWNPSLISKTAIRQTPKRYFSDPSLGAAALGASAEKLMQDFDTQGRLFESLAFRDCSVYAQALHGKVYQYHDYNELEVDIVIVLDDGRWGCFEVKLGPSRVGEGAKNLKALAKKVDKDKLGKPSFLAVLYSGDVGYLRPDGVQVIPIGCLGP
jgi:predicted AAA+ superfamily ATPase